MNAKELVELFESVSPSEKYYDEMQEAATMLREQQAEINKLKDKGYNLVLLLNEGGIRLKEAKAEIDALKKQLEATALLNYNKGHEDGRKLAIPSPVEELTPCEELRSFQEQQNGVFSEHNACCYRHECRIVWNDWEKIRNNPVKELTDEEILEYSDVFALDYSPLYEFTAKGLVLFARAILRKAQEK